MSRPLYFAHANGFPAACYRKLFVALADDFSVSYLNRLGHDDSFPVVDNWASLRDELLTDIRRSFREPVVGVGHSLGGVLLFLAASQAPDLFQGLILLDSPIYDPFKGMLIRMSKWFNWVDKLTPAGRARRRRTHWPDKRAALAYFATKPLFKRFDPDCLRDYVEYGLEPCEQGVCLHFDREIEYHIFRTLPDNLSQYQKYRRPSTVLLYGIDSTLFQARDLRYMREQLDCQTQVTEGGHLFPFEFPQLTALAIKRIVASWS